MLKVFPHHDETTKRYESPFLQHVMGIFVAFTVTFVEDIHGIIEILVIMCTFVVTEDMAIAVDGQYLTCAGFHIRYSSESPAVMAESHSPALDSVFPYII